MKYIYVIKFIIFEALLLLITQLHEFGLHNKEYIFFSRKIKKKSKKKKKKRKKKKEEDKSKLLIKIFDVVIHITNNIFSFFFS